MVSKKTAPGGYKNCNMSFYAHKKKSNEEMRAHPSLRSAHIGSASLNSFRYKAGFELGSFTNYNVYNFDQVYGN